MTDEQEFLPEPGTIVYTAPEFDPDNVAFAGIDTAHNLIYGSAGNKMLVRIQDSVGPFAIESDVALYATQESANQSVLVACRTKFKADTAAIEAHLGQETLNVLDGIEPEEVVE